MHAVHGWLSEKQSKPAVSRLEGNTCLQVVTEETKSPSGSFPSAERIWERPPLQGSLFT